MTSLPATAPAPTPPSAPTDTAAAWQIHVCRAREGGCPHALTGLAEPRRRVEEALRAAGWEAFLLRRHGGRLLPHQRLRVALAACPNACSQPQIKDLGLIADVRPRGIGPHCTACGQCVAVCEENALRMGERMAEFDPRACVGCGLCVRACPVDVMNAAPTAFRVLVGGRMGRHPRWADPLPGRVLPEEVAAVVRRFLEVVMRESGPRDRVSDVVERLGPAALWREIAPART